MDQKVTAISPRLFANSLRRTLATSRPPQGNRLLPALQHPALSYGAQAEEVSIHHSLDLSFQRDIAVSLLDCQIIDNLTSIKQPVPCVQLLASGF